MSAPAIRRITEEDCADPVRLAALLGPMFSQTAAALGSSPEYVVRTVDVNMPAGWTEPTLGGAWTKGVVGYTDPAFWRGSTPTVSLRGTLHSGTYSNSTPLFTLPQSCWPAAAMLFSVAQSSLFEPAGVVEVRANGDVMAPVVVSVQSGTSTYLSLDGISFEAADKRPQPPVYPFPFSFPFGITSKPTSAITLSCQDVTTSPQGATCGDPRWDIVQSGGGAVIRFLDFPGLTPSRKYRIRVLVSAL